jgi:hypothetical protein
MKTRKFKRTYNYLNDEIGNKYDFDLNQLTDAELTELLRCYKQDTGRTKMDYSDIEGILSSVKFNHYWDQDYMHSHDEHLVVDNQERAKDLNSYNNSF